MQMKIILIFAIITQGLCLTGEQVRDRCHCDLTSGVCDMNCCCDTDCFSSLAGTDACFRSKSTQFCIQSAYYYKINSGSFSENNCYYYNQTETLQEEVTTSASSLNIIVNQNSPVQPITTIDSIFQGYQIGDPVNVASLSTLSTLGSNCNAAWTSSTFTLYFGKDLYLACTSNQSGTNLGLFSSFSQKKIQMFAGDTTKSVITPAVTAQTKILTIHVIVNKYGSQNLNYIQAVSFAESQESSPSNLRKLVIKFVDAQQSSLLPQDYPSIFPQIPIDMFFPIYKLN